MVFIQSTDGASIHAQLYVKDDWLSVNIMEHQQEIRSWRPLLLPYEYS